MRKNRFTTETQRHREKLKDEEISTTPRVRLVPILPKMVFSVSLCRAREIFGLKNEIWV